MKRVHVWAEIVDRFAARSQRVGEYARQHRLPLGEAAKRLDQEASKQLAVQEAVKDNLLKAQDKGEMLRPEEEAISQKPREAQPSVSEVTIDRKKALRNILRDWNPKWSKEELDARVEEMFEFARNNPKKFKERFEYVPAH